MLNRASPPEPVMRPLRLIPRPISLLLRHDSEIAIDLGFYGDDSVAILRTVRVNPAVRFFMYTGRRNLTHGSLKSPGVVVCFNHVASFIGLAL